MPSVDVTGTQWRKSSYSGGSGANGDCVEVAFAGSGVAVRDSKTADSGALVLPVAGWRAFMSRVVLRDR